MFDHGSVFREMLSRNSHGQEPRPSLGTVAVSYYSYSGANSLAAAVTSLIFC
jgi:hypothetical protein